MRKALDTLPWVEHSSVQTDVPTREVRFDLKDKQAFNADAVKQALAAGGFPEMSVKAAPK